MEKLSSFSMENLYANPAKVGFYLVTLTEVARIQMRDNIVHNLYTGNLLNDAILYNGGDFVNGYHISFITNYVLSSFGINERIRLGLSFIAGTTATIIAETADLQGLLGTPDLADIPAGVLGAAMHVGLHCLGSWNYRRVHPELRVDQPQNKNLAIS